MTCIASIVVYRLSKIKLNLRNVSSLMFFEGHIFSSIFKACLSWVRQAYRSSVLLINRC